MPSNAGRAEAGKRELPGHDPTPKPAISLQDQNSFASGCKIGAGHETVVPDPTTTISFVIMVATYEVFAIRYAHLERTARHNFLGGDEHDGPMPLDYYVWAIVDAERTQTRT